MIKVGKLYESVGTDLEFWQNQKDVKGDQLQDIINNIKQAAKDLKCSDSDVVIITEDDNDNTARIIFNAIDRDQLVEYDILKKLNSYSVPRTSLAEIDGIKIVICSDSGYITYYVSKKNISKLLRICKEAEEE